ncbi:MAG: hypothetical protein OXC95_09005, partial [Dehalococcoidia bacterium]|nr:hypothetical protein [Dehalococcoidia bacterium]
RFLLDIPQELVSRPDADGESKPAARPRSENTERRSPTPRRSSPPHPRDEGRPTRQGNGFQFSRRSRPSAAESTPVRRSGRRAAPPTRRRGERRPASDAVAAVVTGDKVRHSAFGEGIVMSCEPSGADFEVTVAFTDGGGVKRLLLGLAGLEKIE